MNKPVLSGPDMVADLARFCEQRFRSHGLNVLACVRESERAFDLAVGLTAHDASVVRCVMRTGPGDYQALHTMLDEGDFDRAAIVCGAEDHPPISSEIASYPLSRLDELAAYMVKQNDP